MKAIITGAICTSLLFVAACNETSTSTEKTKTAQVEIKKTMLASGIEKANMDTSVRAQDNFYQHINGGWLKNTEIPGDKTAIGSFYDLRDKADDDVKAIIEELAATKDLKLGSDEQKVADLFRSYMDTESRNAAGIKPIQTVLD